MPTTGSKFKKTARTLSLVVSLAVLAVLGWLISRDMGGTSVRPDVRIVDLPPEIEFTWTPRRELTLNEFKGVLSLKDDHALDFSSYHLRIEELDREASLPIEGLVGKEYTSDIYLSWLASDPRIPILDRLTLEISVADDSGQVTRIRRVILLKPQPLRFELRAE